MTKISLTKIAIAVSTFACAGLLSVGWSEQRGVSLSVEEAQARVGRPLTPVSVAGVARLLWMGQPGMGKHHLEQRLRRPGG